MALISAISVELGALTYPAILADNFEGLAQALSARHKTGRCFVVSNPVVAPLYQAAVVAELQAGGWQPECLLIPDGEDHKTLETWENLVEALLAHGVDRRSPVLALGGGVTGDLVGFAAASVLRGVPLVQLPTTLLAMVDASVGGKTGVNVRSGKNLVGAFHQPSLVWAAIHTLNTLPPEALSCGLGEMIKHAVIEGEEALTRCEAQAPALRAREVTALAELIADSIRLKAKIVAADERESDVRALLNLGHTLGHAIETVAGYGQIPHGAAVALGLRAVLAFSGARGWLKDPALPLRVTRLMEAVDLPIRLPFSMDAAELCAATGFDKKRAHGMLTLVVPEAAGQVRLRPLPLNEIPALVDALLRLG